MSTAGSRAVAKKGISVLAFLAAAGETAWWTHLHDHAIVVLDLDLPLPYRPNLLAAFFVGFLSSCARLASTSPPRATFTSSITRLNAFAVCAANTTTKDTPTGLDQHS